MGIIEYSIRIGQKGVDEYLFQLQALYLFNKEKRNC